MTVAATRLLPLAFLGLGTPVLNAAETTAENEPGPIEEVRVVSSRLEVPLREIPAAISLIGEADLQGGRQQLGLDESLGRVPGVFTQNRYNFAQDLRLAIRGFGARANFGIRGVKVYVDDIPATTPDGQAGVDDIDLASLDRIEVVRGPFSSLHGAAAGGVLSLYSASGTRPGFLEAGTILGEHGHRSYRFKAAGAGDRANYMVSFNDLSLDGYRDHARVESTQFNSRFGLRIDDESTLTVVFNLVDSPQADDAGAITAAQVTADPRQAQARNTISNAGESVEQQRLGLRYERTLANGSELRVRNYYVWREFEAFLPIGTHIPFVADDGVVEFDRFIFGGGVQWFMDSTLGDRAHRLTAGLDVDVQEDDRQRYLNDAGVRGALSFDQIEEAESLGIYLRSELDLASDLTLVTGLRWDSVELEVDDEFLANADQSGRLDFDEWSPSIGLLWTVSPHTTAWANFGTSFETPTFTELASPARNLNVGLGGFANVSAQEAQSFELGLRTQLADPRLQIELAAFTTQVDDEITSVQNIGNRSFFENADTQRRGLEVAAVFEPTETLRATLAWSWSQFEFDAFPSNPAFEGNDLPALPEHQVFAELRWQAPGGFHAVLDALHVDELQVNNANSDATESSFVANFRAGYDLEIDDWRISPFVGINNLFDEEYIANVRANGFGGRLFEPGPDRNVYGGVRIRLQYR